MSHSEIPFVYLMRRQDGVWKIGFSSDPKARRRQLRQHFKQQIAIVYLWQRADAYRVEQLAQRLLRLYLHLPTAGRESFKAPRDVVMAAIEEALRIADTPIPAKSTRILPLEMRK